MTGIALFGLLCPELEDRLKQLAGATGRHLGTMRLRDGARRLSDHQYIEYLEVCLHDVHVAPIQNVGLPLMMLHFQTLPLFLPLQKHDRR